MIADRPQMSLYGDTVAPMVIWAAAKFEGDDTGYPIEWDPTPPEDRTALSEMEWPYVASSAAIRIRPAPAHRDAEDSVSLFDGLWSCAVFELLNHANASKYRAVHENCYSYTREEWVRAYARVEFQTVLAMRRFFRNVWEPWSVEHGHAPVRGHWYADAPDGFEDWLAQFDDPDDYPWRAYGSYYDEHIATANRGD